MTRNDQEKPLSGGEAAVESVGTIVREVTEERRVQDRLRLSEERFRLAADAVNGLIYEADLLTGHVERTRGLYGVFGYRAAEVPPTAAWWREQIHPDDREAREKQFVASTGDTVVSEYRVRHQDGRWLHVEDRAVLLRDRDGKVVKMVGCTTDVTARKRAEAERQDAQRQIATTLESITDAFTRFDRDWRVVYVNDAAERMNQRPRAETIGKTPWELFPALVGTELEAAYRRCVAEQVTVELDYYYEPWHRWFALKCYPTSEGGLIVFIRDVTERKRADDQLRTSEARFRAASEAVSDIIWTNDAQGRMAGEQVGWGRFTGQDQASYQGYGWSNAIHPDDAQPTIDAWNEAVAGKQRFVFEHRVRRSDGQWRMCSVRAVPVVDDRGEITEWVGVHADITERKAAEQRVLASEQRTRLATEATQVGIWEWNILTNTIRWDAQMFRIYGITPTPEGIVDYTDWSGAVRPEDLAENEAILQDTVRRCGSSARTFSIRRRDDGECRHVTSVETARTNERGLAEWVVGTNLDITERKRADDELRRLAVELSEASRRKDEFLATLAHELRNPLAPIRNGLQVIRLAGANGKVEQARAMMDRQLTHLVRLVDDLLDVGRVTSGKLELRKERVELRVVIDAAVETSRPAIEQAGHELVVVVPDEPIFVDGDATRLAQVVSNLLSNSAKYAQRGGHIRLTAGREGGTAVVSVKDDGIGIPLAMLDKVFVMFTQLNRALEKTTGGLGVGLSLVKRLVEMHGGTIEAKSDGDGMGSEFVVRLPVVTPVVAGADQSDEQPSAVAPSALRVLVVDDNVDAAESLAELLELLGNDVRTAYDGEAAIGAAAQFRPDLVLMDLGMPKLNGYEAARRMREHPWSQGMVLVALTGWGQEDDRKKSLDAGFTLHLVKPVAVDVLKKLLAGLKTATA